MHAKGVDAAKGKYALITGGELRNKGAQAMSFIMMAEIKRRFPELEPVLVSGADARPHWVHRLWGRKPRVDERNLDFRISYPPQALALG